MNAYDIITGRIIALLEQGTVPWHKPWTATTGIPQNLITKKPYRGINVFLLMSMRYASPFWLTFHQTSLLGGSVRKGEKSCPVVFWKPLTVKDDQSAEERKIPLLRLYHVFNLAQCDGLSFAPPPELFAPVGSKPDEIVSAMPNRPVIKHGMSYAFYSPTADEVGMPNRDCFDSDAGFYATLFHELVHSTGHASRLRRSTLMENTGFGSAPYSREELIAELGSAFLCGHAGIGNRTIESSAAYLDGWLNKMKSDRTLIVQAAAQAQKAADYIISKTVGPHDEV